MIRKILRATAFFLAGFLALSIALVVLYRFVPVAFTPLMAIRTCEQLFDDKREIRFEKKWVSLKNINPNLVSAVITAEDQKFHEHHGFDIEAIQKSIAYNNRKNGKRIKGGSTISQQTAKNVFLWPNRDWVRKGFEAYFTVLIELIWGKERIMEVYLNVIETGDGIYGAEAASRHFFKKSASRLNRQEAASIAAILPSPLRSNPAKPSIYTKKRIVRILRQMP